MKILIIGYGAVGSVLTELLVKEEEVEAVYCVDIKFIDKVKNAKINFKLLSVLDEQKFTDYLNEIKPDVVINTSLPKFNLDIMKCCLNAKVNYMDTASFWEYETDPNAKIPYKMEELDYHKDFEKNDLIGLIGAGVAPGMDNLLAAECASKLDEVDYLKIRMVEDTGSKEIFFSWNKDWLLDELNSKPLIYENGKFTLAESFGAEEEFEFPKPIGKRKTHYFAQDEVGSIPLYIKTKKMDVKIHDNNIDILKIIVALGLTSNKKIKVDDIEIAPVKVLSKLIPDPIPGEEKKFPKAVFALAAEAIGKKDGKKKAVIYSAVFPNQEAINKISSNGNFISYPTALSTKLLAMQINNITKFGVFPPEALNKKIRMDILKQLEKNHVKVYKKVYTPK